MTSRSREAVRFRKRMYLLSRVVAFSALSPVRGRFVSPHDPRAIFLRRVIKINNKRQIKGTRTRVPRACTYAEEGDKSRGTGQEVIDLAAASRELYGPPRNDKRLRRRCVPRPAVLSARAYTVERYRVSRPLAMWRASRLYARAVYTRATMRDREICIRARRRAGVARRPGSSPSSSPSSSRNRFIPPRGEMNEIVSRYNTRPTPRNVLSGPAISRSRAPQRAQLRVA